MITEQKKLLQPTLFLIESLLAQIKDTLENDRFAKEETYDEIDGREYRSLCGDRGCIECGYLVEQT